MSAAQSNEEKQAVSPTQQKGERQFLLDLRRALLRQVEEINRRLSRLKG